MTVSQTTLDTIVAIASGVWLAVTVLAVIALAWLATVARADERVRLGERLARGEISVDEFRARLASLA